ncbi:MAG: LuxR C-terminal-related transcriptional regulator [[Eubacterium] saphenum]|nr:LuxR C-terminal-related transcriptional regulator [[Eubacterium] saphenum]
MLRNARKCPESGYYIEMRRYYLMLSDEDISGSVYLMSAMSMLYSMLMDFDRSEFWYQKLKEYRDKVRGSEQREATCRLVYLDISLPNRGSTNILDLIKSCYSLPKDRSIPMPEYSVTSNQPSLMNGGKDFCEWSKHDREITVSAGKIVCTFLGKYGKGLVNAALAESFFEKGGDPYEVISLVSKAKLEAETGSKLELYFAANAVLIRQHLVSGNPDAAKSVLDSFEKVAKRDGLKRLLPTIAAMHCRIALMEGDSAAVDNWLKTVPDENEAFNAMERYLYLTKIRCYIAADELDKAYSLIESTRFYAEKCDRKFIAMELSILTAIIMYRRGSAWKDNFVKALEKICEYRFIPIISREGAAVFPLFEECREQCCADRKINRKWFDAIFDAVGKVARRYPLYLKSTKTNIGDISPMDARILACLAEGLSVSKTAERLNINFETLRSRIKELYRRLGAKNKTEAILIAQKMNLI